MNCSTEANSHDSSFTSRDPRLAYHPLDQSPTPSSRWQNSMSPKNIVVVVVCFTFDLFVTLCFCSIERSVIQFDLSIDQSFNYISYSSSSHQHINTLYLKIMKFASAFLLLSGASAFSVSSRPASPLPLPVTALQVTQQKQDAFAAFADSLEEQFQEDPTTTWQSKIDSLLDPATPLASRQLLLSELLAANQEIRDSVQEALTTRKVSAAIIVHTCKYVAPHF
jgi:hypothetical protein